MGRPPSPPHLQDEHPLSFEPAGDVQTEVQHKLASPPKRRRRWTHRREAREAELLLRPGEDKKVKEDDIEVASTFFIDEDELARQAKPVRTNIGHALEARIKRRMNRAGGASKSSSASLTPVDTRASASTPLLSRQDTNASAESAAEADDDRALNLTHVDSLERRNLLRRATKRATKRARHEGDRLRRQGTIDYATGMPSRFVRKWKQADRGEANEADRDAVLVAAVAMGLAKDSRAQDSIRETEEVWENQRGFVFFGRLKFTANARLPGDAAQWTQSDQTPSPYTKGTVPLPDPRWEWSTTWLIDMQRSCDAQGWDYNTLFRSSGWHAYPLFRHSFVRRRRWIRERRIAHPGSTAAAQAPDPPEDLRASEMKREVSAATQTEPSSAPHNSAFADPTTPQAVPIRVTAGPPPDLESMLPALDATKALDVLGWEQPLPARWPFTSYERVVERGSCLHRDDADRSDGELHGAWRDAVVECNYRRVARVLAGCPLDRERLDFWRAWIEEGPPQDLEDGSSDDVWQLLEARLDVLLSLFEYQAARGKLLDLVSQQHGRQHGHHRFASYDHPNHDLPDCLSPTPNQHRDKLSTLKGRAHVPRMQFWHDVERLRADHPTSAEETS